MRSMNFVREFFSVSVIVHILDAFCNISSRVSTDFEEATKSILCATAGLSGCVV
jgi:hypothetical protein